jgi:hypothetical protein
MRPQSTSPIEGEEFQLVLKTPYRNPANSTRILWNLLSRLYILGLSALVDDSARSQVERPHVKRSGGLSDAPGTSWRIL